MRIDEEHDEFAQKIRKAEREGDLKTIDNSIISLAEDIKNFNEEVEIKYNILHKTPTYTGSSS